MLENLNFYKGTVNYNELMEDDLNDFSNLSEDLIQVYFGDIILDIGYYQDQFKIYVVKEFNWEKPIEELDCGNDVGYLINTINKISKKLSNID